MKLKAISGILAMALILTLLAACGSKGSSENGSSASPSASESASASASASESAGSGDSGKPITLNMWAALDSTEAGKKTLAKIEAFNNLQKDVQVNVQIISYDVMHDKLIAAINAGDAPDLTWGLSEWFGELNKMDALADMTPYIDKWEDKSKIFPNVLDAVTVDGKVKALPNYLGIRALLYHKDILAQAGYNAPPKTWDELLKMASVIKEKTGKEAFGIAGKGVRSPQELMMYLAQNGLTVADRQADGKYKNTWADNPDQLKKAAEVFKFYQDLLATKTIKSDAKTWGWEEEDQNFALGQYAMVVNGPWMEGRAKDNPDTMKDVEIAAPIYSEKPATFLEVAMLFPFKSDHPDATWKLASYLIGKDYQTEINYAGNSPRSDVQATNKWGKDFLALAPQGQVFPPVSLSGITTALEDSLARAMLKNDKPEVVAQWLSDAINESLRKTGELSGS
ncbi:extracellular solute-binding protein [Cohnella sp. CFH 77786]|uniref:ABC transporter substrate-binding protein n=1 Tax=Cohnella sp. CFH 77786 TaxID=2662265 RepID=UPI001C6086DB|nr:sugar ABC transporter substrate-binding protein [Cohnella sp. CFH 77786]MBW5447596.1 extracellular solute-binding protein [Cohnella sp. CFH 77786]